MIELAPDIWDPSVHTGENSPAVCKNMYAMRKYAAKFSPIEHAKNWIRSELGRGLDLDDIERFDGGNCCAHYGIYGGSTQHIPKGKLLSRVYGKGEILVSINELYKEIVREKKQPDLFKIK